MVVQIMNSLKMFALQVIPSIIGCRHIVQVICVRVVILSSCLSVLLICIRDLLLSDLCTNMFNKIAYSVVLLRYSFIAYIMFVLLN